MAVMMVIMVLVLLSPGHHFGSHDSHASTGPESQSHRHGTEQERAPDGNS